MTTADTEETFQKYREGLRVELMKLAAYVRIYRELNERKQDRLRELNLAPAFFTFTEDALFSAIILWGDKLFGERSERGLLNFLSFIELHRELFHPKELQRRANLPDDHWLLKSVEPLSLETVRNDRQRISNFAPLKSFRIRRDKFHAHFDKDYFFSREKLQEDSPIKWDDLEQLVQLGKDILNCYSGRYDGLVSGIEPVNAADVNYILDRLHSSIERELACSAPNRP